MYAGTLTEADLARIHAVRDESMRVGLSTDRCDRPKAEAAVRAAYVAAGLPEPELAIWMDSPLGGAVASAALKGDQLWDQLVDQLRKPDAFVGERRRHPDVGDHDVRAADSDRSQRCACTVARTARGGFLRISFASSSAFGIISSRGTQ